MDFLLTTAGKPAGILVRNLDELPRQRALGYTHVAIDSDVAILRQRYRNLLAEVREADGSIATAARA